MNNKNLSLIGVLLITLIITSCNKKETPNDLEIAELKGKVKSVSTSLTSNYSNGIVEKRNNTKTLYNIEGFEIYKEDLGNIGGDDGEFSNSKTEIKRDSNNNKTEENTTILSGTTSYKSSSIKYNYNSDGNLIEKVILYDNVISNTTIYKYDDTENIVEESQLVNNGSPNTTIYKYDEKDNLIEQKSNGYTENYEYNSKGDVSLKKLTMDGEKYSTIRIYKYNDKGDKINETYKDRGNSQEINYKYDTKNNLIEIDDDENRYIINYEYDDFGNWIKEIKKVNDDTYVTERKIDYYSDEDAVSINQQNSLPGKYQIASERILSENDIANIDKYELKLMKNEIFARYGYIFKTPEMKAYFESQNWYKPKYDDVTSYLTEIEKNNIALINGTNDFDSNNNINKNENGNSKTFDEIQLTLTDATIKKAKLYLGEPDKYEYAFGHITKGFAIYYDRVSNNGKPKHLVLFLRMQGNQWGNNAEIEEIYSVEDGQKACFGIHCIMIKK
jgi:hypothetical protein